MFRGHLPNEGVICESAVRFRPLGLEWTQCILLSRSRCGGLRSSPEPVVGGSGATRTRRGVVYVFRAKRADRIKLVFWNGTGLCLFAKRLEDGIFRWPKIEDGVMRLSAAQLSALLEGLDWRLVHEARETPARTQPGLLLAVLRRSESGVSDASPDGDE
ncbi:transposase [Bradyrhizobium zhanjiangense]|uniref:Transposase n=1 Tax=Bradyrhizobium zhanjiangense TaxID=1325107 RepID=A0ABY0D9E8_9BRAD|nr:transposase [Bradyrhizobium zhanjiangense]